MQLSERLRLVAEFAVPCCKVADIGTDHGYVPIALVEEGKAECALAMDINKGPLLRAGGNIAAHGLEEKISVRQSDGLEKLQRNEADTVIIAGMGGGLTVRILRDGHEALDTVKNLVLSPHSEVFLVRKYLLEHGYQIMREDMVKDMGKFYTVLRAEKEAEEEKVQKEENHEPYKRSELYYGRLLIGGNHPVLREFLELKQQVYETIFQGMAGQNSVSAIQRKQEIEEEICLIRQTLEIMSGGIVSGGK